VGCLSHQLGNGCQLAEQIPGPWQVLQTLQFSCSLLEPRCEERIARANALSPAAPSKVLGIMRSHQYASCNTMWSSAGISPADLLTAEELHRPSSQIGVGNGLRW
jgi:hypothetical protein